MEPQNEAGGLRQKEKARGAKRSTLVERYFSPSPARPPRGGPCVCLCTQEEVIEATEAMKPTSKPDSPGAEIGSVPDST